MKLIGKIAEVGRRVAKAHTTAPFEEKRTFKVNVRPASKPDSYYGYGDMTFTLNGTELESFGLDLGDAVDVFVVREGEALDGRDYQDLERRYHDLEAKHIVLEKSNEQAKERLQAYERMAQANRARENAAVQENARLLVQLEALKMARAIDPHIDTIEYKG
jgi:hypothetical protein